jgi:hypothetical protein
MMIHSRGEAGAGLSGYQRGGDVRSGIVCVRIIICIACWAAIRAIQVSVFLFSVEDESA